MADPNPFRPPSTEVDDLAAALPPSPPGVRIAGYLVLLSFLLGLPTLLPGVRPVRTGEPDSPLWATLVVVVLFGVLTLWLVLQTQRGRHWARWALLAYLALGWYLVGPDLQEDFALSPLAGAINVVCILLEVAAALMLFVGPANRWFAEVRARPRR